MNQLIKRTIKKVIQAIFPSSLLLDRVKADGVVLTFDDGPHPKYTPRILKILTLRGIKAVFFVRGDELQRYPDLGRLIVDNGHIIGNHTFEHLDLKGISFREYLCSIKKANSIISSIQTYSKCILFRPPYGRFSWSLLSYAVRTRLILLYWTIDSRDSFIKQDSDLSAYVKGLTICNGDVLLFHDDYRHTVDALPNILDYFQGQGIQFILPEVW